MAIRLSKNLKQQPSQNGFDVSGEVGKSYNLDEIQESKSRTSNSALRTQVTDKKPNEEGTIAVKTSDGKILMNNADAAKYLFKNEPSSDAYNPSVTLRRPIVIWEEGTADTSLPNTIDNYYEDFYALEENVEELTKNLQNIKDIINAEYLKKFEEMYDSFQIETASLKKEMERLKKENEELQAFKDSVVSEIKVTEDGELVTLGEKIPNVYAVHKLLGKYEIDIPDEIDAFGLIVNNGEIKKTTTPGFYMLDISDDKHYDLVQNVDGNYYVELLGGKR